MNLKSKKLYIGEINRILVFIDKNYTKDIRFSDISEFSNIGVNNLKKYFKDITGFSVMNYLKNYRVNKAKEFIKENTYTFTEIAQMLGYDSIHYFSRQFKKIEGISPTKYKQQIEED